jgi:hypothetical protein
MLPEGKWSTVQEALQASSLTDVPEESGEDVLTVWRPDLMQIWMGNADLT